MKYWAILAGLMVTSAWGQTKPDFSGTWKAAGSSDQNSHIEKIVHQDPNLTVDLRTHFVNSRLSGGTSGENTYVIDGVEHASKDSKGVERWRTNSWEGAALVFLRISKDGYHVTVTREVWTLAEDGATLTKTRRVINMDGVTETKQVFERQ